MGLRPKEHLPSIPAKGKINETNRYINRNRCEGPDYDEKNI